MKYIFIGIFIGIITAVAVSTHATELPEGTVICSGYMHFDEPECDDGTKLPPYSEIRDTLPEWKRDLLDSARPFILDLAQVTIAGESLNRTAMDAYRELPMLATSLGEYAPQWTCETKQEVIVVPNDPRSYQKPVNYSGTTTICYKN